MPTSAVIAKLRDTLRAIEGDGHRRRETLPFGIGEIDTRLAAGGLRLDALHEIAPATPDLADDACATLLLAGIAARAWGPVLWVVRRRDLFAPGLYQAGLSPERVIYAEARDDAELLALMEEGIRHRGLGAVVGEARRAAMASTRRLQLAAEGGRTIALLMKRHAREGGDPLAVPSAAVTRWRVAAAPSAPPARREAVARAAASAATPVARIGRISAEPGLRLVDAQGRALAGRYASFDHFGG